MSAYQNSNWLEASHQIRMSLHARQRASQRGLTIADLNLVMEFGEWVADGFLMSEKARNKARETLKKQGGSAMHKALQRLDHLRNVVVIEEAGTMITIYRADKKRINRLRSGHVKTLH